MVIEAIGRGQMIGSPSVAMPGIRWWQILEKVATRLPPGESWAQLLLKPALARPQPSADPLERRRALPEIFI